MCVKEMEGTVTATCLSGVWACPLMAAAVCDSSVTPPAFPGFWTPSSTGLSVSMTGSSGVAG